MFQPWRKEMCAEKTVRGGVGGSDFALQGHCTPLSENLEQANSASIHLAKLLSHFGIIAVRSLK